MADICIFPIPSCVTFPGTEFPLHVFEPRYREMIRYCIETSMPVAICHTRKLVSSGKSSSNVKESLSSNQATYRTFDVVSAGLCQLHETTEDGRMYLSVHLDQRYRLLEEKQMLPYQIFECDPFPDVEPSEIEHQDNKILRDKILHRLTAVAEGEQQLEELLDTEEWMNMTAEDFSFQVFGSIRFDDEIQQDILELDSANKRLNLLLKLLNSSSS